MTGSFTFNRIDWGKSTDAMQLFDEENICVQNLQLNRTAVIIIELYKYDMREKTVEQYGFAIYPLLEFWEGRPYL